MPKVIQERPVVVANTARCVYV